MRISSTAATDRGRVRSANEDAFLLAPERSLFAVADGMGGHAAGEVASRLAVEALAGVMADAPAGTPRADLLRQAVAEANRRILEAAERDPSLFGMGTTLTALDLAAGEGVIAHVGDSRAYRLREGRLERLTQDHTVVQRYIDLGEISPVEARTHPMRHILTRALGTEEEVGVDMVPADMRTGDLVLLCSDGLTGMVEEADLEALLGRQIGLEELADELVRTANMRGGEDNVTVVLLRLE